MYKVSGIALNGKGKTYFFNSQNFDLKKKMNVIVETEKGLQYGQVVVSTYEVADEDIGFSLKNVIRIATKEDEKNVNAENGDYEGIVNEGRNIEGVEVSIFLHELDNGFKASLRANNYVNVSDVCLMFGGGGHLRAAGATMQGTPQEIKKKVLAEVKRRLK